VSAQSDYWQRLAAKRLSRRRLLAGAGTAALGGAVAMLVGCGSGGGGRSASSATTTAAPSPVAGGNVTFGRLAYVLGIDPHIDLTGLDINRLVYSYLYDWDATTEEMVLNNLAEGFEQPDPLTYIFTLRQGVMTHPGDYAGANDEMTAEDCRQSFLRRGSSITSPDKRFPYRIAGSRDKAMLDAALQAPDRYTFTFTMADPFVAALSEMARSSWAIVPAKVINEYGLRLSQRAHGSGPFMLEEFRGTERIILRRHPNYFHQGRPYLETIAYLWITDGSSLLDAFESGVHDVCGATLDKEWYDGNKRKDEYRVSRGNALSFHAIQYKITRPPFNDPRVLAAIDLAIDRDSYIETVLDGEGQYNGPVPWALQQWALPQEELRAFYEPDRGRARALLAEAGHGAGFRVTLKLPRVSDAVFLADTASLIVQSADRIGVDLELDAPHPISVPILVLPGNFDMALMRVGPIDEPGQALSAYHSNGTTGNGNETNYTNPQLDQLIDAQAREFDPEVRRGLIYEAQRLILREHGPQVALPSGYEYSARWRHAHFPGEDGAAPPPGKLPYGCDIWTEKGDG